MVRKAGAKKVCCLCIIRLQKHVIGSFSCSSFLSTVGPGYDVRCIYRNGIVQGA